MFGEALPPDAEGKVKHRPFHSYTMKQAIEERLHPRCAQELHARGQLLQASEEDRGRSGVRHQEGAKETAEVCREPRPRDPPQGRDHGGPLPRSGAGGQEDRRESAGDGRVQRHRAGHPVFPRDQGVSRRTQKSVSGDRRVFRRARVRRGESQRVLAEWISKRRHRRANPEDPYRFLICADKFQTGYDEPSAPYDVCG